MANKKNKKVDENENERLINQLPDEIVLSSILSYFTIKELANTRLVSHHWNRSLHHISVLNFDNSITKRKIKNHDMAMRRRDAQLLDQERWSFMNGVHHVLSEHLGSTIDQFKLIFDLINTHKFYIDIWLIWAFSKHVKKVELDLSPASSYYEADLDYKRYFLDESLFKTVQLKAKPVLTCLCLKSVNVTTPCVEQLLESCCSTLENLFIEKSEYLTSIRIRNSVEMKALKCLKVFWCRNLDAIDISAPKLLCFIYDRSGPPNGLKLLRIAKVLSLSRVWINVSRQDCLVNALTSLSNCISQLEYLKLRWYLQPNVTMVFNSLLVLANLKHLEFCVNGSGHHTMAEWIPLIKACPLLEKLTLQLCCADIRYSEKLVVIHDRHPLWCLKTLEIMGFVGCNVDLDVANFVLQNGVSLQEVIVQRPWPMFRSEKPDLDVLRYISDLKIPQGVKLIII